MAGYGKVYRRMWSSPEFRDLPEDARTLFPYLLTTEHGTSEGFFNLPIAFIAHDLQWDLERSANSVGDLVRTGFVLYDDRTSTVLVNNALKFNAPSRPNNIKGAAKVVKDMRDTPLRRVFLDQCDAHCPPLAAILTSEYGWERGVYEPDPIEPSPDSVETQSGPSLHSPSPSPSPSQGQDILAKADALPDTADAFAGEFDLWWQTYPRKVKKQAAFNAYKARRRAGTAAEALTQSLGHYAASRRGEPDSFTMHGATFLSGNDGPWLEWLTGPPETPTGTQTTGGTRQARSRAALDEWASRFEAADAVGELSA